MSRRVACCVLEEQPEGAGEDADGALLSGMQVPAASQQRRRIAAFTGSGVAFVAVAAYVSYKGILGRAGAAGAAGVRQLARQETKVLKKVCAGLTENCLDSECCTSGGEKGYQCYEKNPYWGECFELGNCTAGESLGGDGFDWNCKARGMPSKPKPKPKIKPCEGHPDSHCPIGRCLMLKQRGCVTQCNSIKDGGKCWKAPHCMWAENRCQGACWEVQGTNGNCSLLPHCQWLDGADQCAPACHVHTAKDCPTQDPCLVENGKCKKDPCSAGGENCKQTSCCSAGRDTGGKTCFEKNESFATCLDFFDPERHKGWTGRQIGERAKFEPGCAWAVQDCSKTKLCCNEGFNCVKKDKNVSGCMNSEKAGWAHGHESTLLPKGWEGDVLGHWRSEFAVDPVPAGRAIAGTSLFCLMVVMPDSPEVELRQAAEKNKGSIFGCDAYKVFNTWKTVSASWNKDETSLSNANVFLKVFEWVRDGGEHFNHDWTVKVEPDCVFLPHRLRKHLSNLRPPPNTAMYLKNANIEGLGSTNFMAPIEVFSKRAVQIYMDNDGDCARYLRADAGEAGFFKGCMDALGVGFMWDKEMLKPNYDPAHCVHRNHVAYHPMKHGDEWQRCWDIAAGIECQGLDYARCNLVESYYMV